MTYNELTRRHFEVASHAGVLVGDGVSRGAAGDRAHGTWVQFDVRLAGRDGAARVREARFLAYGCPHVIAVADWVAEHAAGAAGGPAAAGGLPESVSALQQRFAVPVEKRGRLLIIEDAWRAALSSPYRMVTA
jgi:NifU-like protein involved in Fe-S cluster formation